MPINFLTLPPKSALKSLGPILGTATIFSTFDLSEYELHKKLRNLSIVGISGDMSPTAIERPDFRMVAERFRKLADKWERETRNLSSARAIMGHGDYEKIIQMGDSVIPLILERMTHRPWFWFRALKELSGEKRDPVTPEMRGDLCAMTEAWLQWGVGYASRI